MDDPQRYYPNPWLTTSSGDNEDLPHREINFIEEAKRLATICQRHYTNHQYGDIKDENQSHSSRISLGSLYCGPISALVYLPLRFALLHESTLMNKATLTNADDTTSSEVYFQKQEIAQCHGLLLRALKDIDNTSRCNQTKNNRFTLLESEEIGIIAMLISIQTCSFWAFDEKPSCEEFSSDNLANRILKYHTIMESKLSNNECELLYGRAGYLQCILYIRKNMSQPSSFGKDVVLSVIESILQEGQAKSKKYNGIMTLMWEWHGKVYLGAAHGIAGILHILLHYVEEINVLTSLHQKKDQSTHKVDYLEMIENTICELNEKMCFASTGNLASSYENKSDKLVHWCHGGTGYVLLLVKAYEVFNKDFYLTRAKYIARNVIWQRGLLRKGVGLCHGISGNAYSFLAVYNGMRLYNIRSGKPQLELGLASICDRDDDPITWLEMAKKFASIALFRLSELEHRPDRPYSLYEGIAGLCSLLIDLHTPQDATFPFFEFN